jgi:protein phosphatase
MKAFGITHRGAVRKENQDCFRIDAPSGTQLISAVLCDGMGGAQAGSIASSMAADAFMSHASNSLDESSGAGDMQSILTDAVNYANIKVYDKSFSDFTCMGMGSTLVAVLMNSKRTMVANVGDSRAYLISKGSIKQITRDHSLVAELLRAGKISPQQAKEHPQKNIITRAIGVEASVKCDLFDIKAAPDSRVLLCSDGLSNLVGEEEILSVLDENSDCRVAAERLLNLALERGAPDNVTVLIAER